MKRDAILTAILSAFILLLLLIVLARLDDVSKPKEPEPTFEIVYEMPPYDPLEVIIEHEYIYKPLPVDYAVTDVEPDDDAAYLAKTMYGEYRNASNYEQCTAVAWCVLNRVDSDVYPDSIKEVVSQPFQFSGYSANNPVDADLYAMACEVLALWNAEKLEGYRTLPQGWLYFTGNGSVNIYTHDGEEFIP